uniref:Uncharacterized protein n=1 Tax=Anguilla anguilla TaxID=7936 RepID=A0A0E9PEM9_ANGAN
MASCGSSGLTSWDTGAPCATVSIWTNITWGLTADRFVIGGLLLSSNGRPLAPYIS